MKFWQLILLLGNYFHHWTPAIADGTYRPIIRDSTLVNIEIIGTPMSVNLSHSNIRSIANNALDGLENVQELDLSENRIGILPQGLFSKLNNLIHLDMRGCHLPYLKSGYFNGLPKTVNIMVSPRSITSLSTGIFKNAVNSAPVEEEIPKPEHPQMVNHDLPYVLCMTDGILNSFKQGKTSDKCNNAKVIYPFTKNGEIFLNKQNIRGFGKNWCLVQNSEVNTIAFPHNKITDITKELINDLPSNIIKIYLQGNKIETVKNEGIANDNLRVLFLEYNRLKTIEDGAFEKLKLTHLALAYNLLENTRFSRTLPTTLESLTLSDNRLTEIPSDTFQHLEKLKVLDLSKNQLKNLQPSTFKGLNNLEQINLAYNKIMEIRSNTFDRLNLEKLNLFMNELEIIEGGAFSNTSIEELNLKDNKISNIGDGAFHGAHIVKIDLAMNQMRELTKKSFDGISGITELSLNLNPLKIIEKGSMLNFRDVKRVNMKSTEIKALENGMLFGLSTDNVDVNIDGAPIELIQGGVFDDV